MFKFKYFLSFFADALIKLCLGLVFFNFGYGKLIGLINGESQNLIQMVENIVFFGMAPVFFSWCLAISETFLIFGLAYGLFSILPYSNFITKISGIIALIISIVIIYQHIWVWGDNIFSYGPFNFLNTNEGKKSVYGQLLFIPLSLYVIFNNKLNFSMNIESK